MASTIKQQHTQQQTQAESHPLQTDKTGQKTKGEKAGIIQRPNY
jgi:hypothetical protein